MSKQLLVGIDVGTTGVKTILFEADGTVFASAYQEYGCIYPQPGWVEQDPEMLLDAIYATCRQAMSAVEGAQVAAISVSAQRSSAILLDDSGHALKMISWLDNRAVEQSDEIAAQFGAERFYQITGLPLCATWILPKLLHTRKNSPELWRRTRRVCQLHDFVLHALGADDFYGNEAEAGFWGLWDNQNLCYSDDLLRAFSIDRTMLPEIRRTGERVGTISADVSEKTGFPLGTPLCIGVGDQNSAALGAGVVEPGAVSICWALVDWQRLCWMDVIAILCARVWLQVMQFMGYGHLKGCKMQLLVRTDGSETSSLHWRKRKRKIQGRRMRRSIT